METVLKAIADWIKGILTAGIMSNLSGLFDDVNPAAHLPHGLAWSRLSTREKAQSAQPSTVWQLLQRATRTFW